MCTLLTVLRHNPRIIKSPKSWQGVSLTFPQLAKRKEFLTEYLWETPIIPPSKAIPTGRWKYFWYINDPQHEELYDLTLDPLEINYLGDDPGNQAFLTQLRKKPEKKIKGFSKERIE